jgi:hypothetical protein
MPIALSHIIVRVCLNLMEHLLQAIVLCRGRAIFAPKL